MHRRYSSRHRTCCSSLHELAPTGTAVAVLVGAEAGELLLAPAYPLATFTKAKARSPIYTRIHKVSETRMGDGPPTHASVAPYHGGTLLDSRSGSLLCQVLVLGNTLFRSEM